MTTRGTHRWTHTLFGRLAVAIAVVGLLLFSPPAPAQAHNYLTSSTPSAGEVLTALPDEFVITTNDELLSLGDGASGFALQVLDSNGLYYGDGCVTVAGHSMSATAALGEPGDYTLRWQIVSIDGHTVSDEFEFSWEPAGEHEPSVGSPTAPVCGEPAPTPTETPAATDEPVTPTPTVTAEADPTDTQDDNTLLWVGAAIAAAAVTTGAILFARRRKKQKKQ